MPEGHTKGYARRVRAVRRTASSRGRVTTDKLYLVGFMGAGKTTIARALSRRIGWRFEDIDERIEARARRSVAGIFAQHGEPYFRQLERQVLASWYRSGS